MGNESDDLQVKKNYPCTYEGCNASFVKNSKLVYHIRRHTGERPFVCDEPNCDKSYRYSFHLRRHKEVHLTKPTEERFLCPNEGCYFELANKYSLKKHIKRKHNPERRYPITCDTCKQGFFKKRQLVQHSYAHTGIFPYECEKCDTRFPDLHSRNRHMRTHSSYSCTCGDTFERWSQLLSHKKSCGKLSYICNICDRPFNKAVNLQQHLRLHMVDGSQKFYCGYDKCLRVYLHKKNLIYHINICHKSIARKRIECTHPDCKSTFTRKQNLKLHIEKVHTTSTEIIKKKPRSVRKDKGVPRSDPVALLVGITLVKKNRKTNGNSKTVETIAVPQTLAEIITARVEDCLKTIQ